ncbi:hypothetical protein LCGC14_0476080 [marine sediment metagenome]|uniref:Uncharacterized protein n=1 Tax=marine sediment metagenome TaxID=412755 RepID=A0A0F9UXR7_9ZZZZ
MILKVRKYLDGVGQYYHECTDENGKEHRVDLMVNGDFHDSDITPEDLVGKTVSVDYTYPHIEIGMEVVIIPEE